MLSFSRICVLDYVFKFSDEDGVFSIADQIHKSHIFFCVILINPWSHSREQNVFKQELEQGLLLSILDLNPLIVFLEFPCHKKKSHIFLNLYFHFKVFDFSHQVLYDVSSS